MNANKRKSKEKMNTLHKSLQAVEFQASKRRQEKLLQAKLSENLFSLGNLVFGGVMIGGIFEEVDNPFLLYAVGTLAFGVLYIWAINKYKKSIKE